MILSVFLARFAALFRLRRLSESLEDDGESNSVSSSITKSSVVHFARCPNQRVFEQTILLMKNKKNECLECNTEVEQHKVTR